MLKLSVSSTGPEATVATHHIEAIPIAETFVKSWSPEIHCLEWCEGFVLEYQASFTGGLRVL